MTPVNVCRLCVVELEGSRVLVPACSRKVEPGMAIRTDSERVRLSRKMVLEFLASSVDLSTWPAFREYCERYGAAASRFEKNADHDRQPVKIDNQLYVRDYAKCVLCYKCVQACGVEAQFTFAIGVAGRGARIGVCPTGALMFRSEFEMRRSGTWDEPRQTKTDTICPYCGVGCDLTVHTQDGEIVKVTSPLDHSVTSGHLCIKGRFGWQFVHVQSAPQSDR